MAQLSGMFIYPVVHLSGVHCTIVCPRSWEPSPLLAIDRSNLSLPIVQQDPIHINSPSDVISVRLYL